MSSWVCPHCQRTFGRTGQGHECAPAMSIDEYFHTGPPFERPVFDAVRAVLDPLGTYLIEPVSVGILMKRSRVFVELRPHTKWVAMTFLLGRQLDSDRLARNVVTAGWRHFHTVNLARQEDVDDTIGAWLVESYHALDE